MKKPKILLTAITFALATFTFIAKAEAKHRTIEDSVRELTSATDTTVSTYLENGMAGLSSLVSDCYEEQGYQFYCLYLDTASRQIDEGAVAAMNFPAMPYFTKEEYFPRIASVLLNTGITDAEEARNYLEGITIVINEMLSDKLKQVD